MPWKRSAKFALRSVNIPLGAEGGENDFRELEKKNPRI